MYKLMLPVLLAGYLLLKYRLLGQTEPGPVEGKVLFPRQDARFAHSAMSILQTIFLLEFISHTSRNAGAWIRLSILFAVMIMVDVVFWLKLKNTAISYDAQGITVRSFLGREKTMAWQDIKEVRTAGTGVKSTRVFTLKTSLGNIRINAKSGGLERFRRILEEKLS